MLLIAEISFTWQYSLRTQTQWSTTGQPNVSTCSSDSSLDLLDEFSLLSILDLMDFEQLFQMADCGERIRRIIHDHYARPKYKIDSKTIYIGKFRADRNQTEFTGTSIHLRDYLTSLRFIRIFGPIITKLAVSTTLEPYQSKWIGEYLNEYSTESLTHLNIAIISDKMISNWNKSFTKVVDVKLSVGAGASDNVCQLHRFFPSVRRLQIKWNATSTTTCLRQQFRYMKRLKYMDNTNSENNINQLLEANNQLVSFHMENECDMDFLMLLNRTVPHLDELAISNFKADFFEQGAYKDINFVNLKRLRIELLNGGANRKIEHFPFHFERLEEFELVQQNIPDKWADFIVRHEHLKKLRVAADAWTLENWQRISERLQQLTELSVLYRYRSSNGIFHLITHSPSLQLITFEIQLPPQQEYIRRAMSHDWKVISENTPYPYDMTYVRVD